MSESKTTQPGEDHVKESPAQILAWVAVILGVSGAGILGMMMMGGT